MPELPEVLTMANCLDTTLKGKKFLSGSVKCQKMGTFSEQPFPWTCLEVRYRCKRLIFEFENSKGSKFWLVSFLAMTGRWLFDENKYTCLTFNLDTGEKLYYDDARKFGSLKTCDSEESLEKEFSTYGPDWFSDGVSLKFFREKIKSRRNQETHISKFLLDHQITSGIGNYIKSEAIYLASKQLISQNEKPIYPYTTLEDISSLQIKELYRAIIAVMNQAIKDGGFTQKDYLHPNGKKGKYQPVIYGLFETADGEKVVKGTFGDARTSHYVEF